MRGIPPLNIKHSTRMVHEIVCSERHQLQDHETSGFMHRERSTPWPRPIIITAPRAQIQQRIRQIRLVHLHLKQSPSLPALILTIFASSSSLNPSDRSCDCLGTRRARFRGEGGVYPGEFGRSVPLLQPGRDGATRSAPDPRGCTQ